MASPRVAGKTHLLIAASVLAALLVAALPAQAQEAPLFERVQVLPAHEGSQFGRLIHGGDDLILASYAPEGPMDRAVALYERGPGGSWSYVQDLVGGYELSGSTMTNFGDSMASYGDWIAIGAPQAKGHGGVEIFHRHEGVWSWAFSFDNPDAQATAFGASLALGPDSLIVGAPGDHTMATVAGAIYHVRYDDEARVWHTNQVTKHFATDAIQDGLFGSSLAMSGDRIAVGSVGHPGNAEGAGAAYVFKTTTDPTTLQKTLEPEARLEPSTSGKNHRFGQSVAIDGDTVLVGAPRHNTGQSPASPGSVYVFEGTAGTWTQTQVLGAGPAAEDGFGIDMDLRDGTAVIGAPYDSQEAEYGGTAYVFEQDGATWQKTARLHPSDDPAGGQFTAFNVAQAGDDFVVGSLLQAPAGAFNVYGRIPIEAPTAGFNLLCDGISCTFDGSLSSDDRTIAAYDWDFGDGGTATGITFDHLYGTPGTYNVTLTVTDDQGATGQVTQTIELATGATLDEDAVQEDTDADTQATTSGASEGGDGVGPMFWLVLAGIVVIAGAIAWNTLQKGRE
ncbi:MAG: PKD domain-containing protein [Thermoplasmatota archaeon]